MEHPPKQGLKLVVLDFLPSLFFEVLMEHPPKQGLKQGQTYRPSAVIRGF